MPLFLTWKAVVNPDPEVTSSGSILNVVFYTTSRPDLRIRIYHCRNDPTNSKTNLQTVKILGES